jgi:hypothetical protein
MWFSLKKNDQHLWNLFTIIYDSNKPCVVLIYRCKRDTSAKTYENVWENDTRDFDRWEKTSKHIIYRYRYRFVIWWCSYFYLF